MILLIIVLPIIGSIVSGLLGRYIGYIMSKYIATLSIIISGILCYYVYFDVMVNNNIYNINLGKWIWVEHIEVDWGFIIDELAVSLLVPIVTVSSLVHIYACSYMSHDPHQSRFFSILSMFTGFMIVLVTGNNYVVMFLGWELIGVASYLLISFWHTRLSAVKSGLSALLMNKFGDTFITIGLFILLYTFGSLNYSSIYSLSVYINTDILNIIMILLLLGCAAKSAQLGLHNWLLSSMEGRDQTCLLMINNTNENPNKKVINMSKLYISKSILKEKTKNLIYVYIVSTGELINNKPYKSKLSCSKELKINRGTILKYINNGEVFKYKYLFSYKELNKEIVLSKNINNNIWNIVTGELLGDGYICYDPVNNPKTEGYLGFTFSLKNKVYAEHLKYKVLSSICTNIALTPWPKNNPSQYTFKSKSMYQLSNIHKEWYKWDGKKYIKILPNNIYDLLTPISISHWIMGDGYYDTCKGSVKICTDNFTKEEVEILSSILKDKFGIISTLHRRKIYNKDKEFTRLVYRLYISRKSLDKLIELVKPNMIPEMYYKLGIK